MANWAILKKAIASAIKTNGNQEITGAVLQNTIYNIINSVGKNATFAGIATPTTNPGMQDGPVFYFTVTPGIYPNFNGIEVENQGLSILYCEDENWKSLSVYTLVEGDGNVIVTPIYEGGEKIAIINGISIYAPKSTVDVKPILIEGTPIATINGVKIYAPESGEGGGTASVDVVPILTSGTPIATINGVRIYAPQGGTASVNVTPILTSGTHIATINGVRIYAPVSGGTASVDVTPILTSGTHIATINGVRIYAPVGGGTAGASTWAELAGKPSWLTDSKPSVSTFQNDAGYITSSALSGYATTYEVDHKDEQVLTSVAQNYGKKLGTDGKYISLLNKSGSELNKVIAPYAAYTDQLGATNSTAVSIYGNATLKNGSLAVAGDVTVARSLTVTGESHFNGAVYLPGQFTFFGQNGIYIQADRTTQSDGTAAYIGVHRSFSGVNTIAHVNLDGRVKIAQPMGIRQDPETDISLRVGGVLKTDHLIAGVGMTRPEGYWFASPNGYFGNPSSGTYTSFGDGGIELSHPTTPYIDFHWNKSTADFTSRLVASEDGVVQIQSATADPALRIGNAYLRYDEINHALYVTGSGGAQVHLYATGGIAAYSGLGSSITQLANLSLSGQLTAASVKANSVGSDGDLRLNADSESSIILNKNTTVDSDGWITTPQLNATQRIVVNSGGDIRIGSTTADYRITDVHADGTYVYITVNKKRYRLTPSSTTAV